MVPAEPETADTPPNQSAAMTATATPPADVPWVQPLGGSALDPRIQPQCSLAVQLRRVSGNMVGRTSELAAIRQHLADARTRLSALTLEGEPGIGKTRLLLAAANLASTAGFTTIAVTADEEIRGPFLLAQSIFAAPALRDAISGQPAEASVRRALDAISGRDEPGLENLSRDAKQLRAFDLGAVALAQAAMQAPIALLIDDVQWADDDTLRLLRYAVRADADEPIFLFLAIRPDEFATVTEAVNFVADMERMGLVTRIRPGRFSQSETGELATQALGGPVDPASIAAMHAQSEGVPFIVEELARTYREAGMVQQVDGKWTLGRNAAKLVPSAVRTLIQRRAGRLGEETRSALADAAVLGRSFSLRDLAAIRGRLDPGVATPESLGDVLHPAVSAGLLLQQIEGAPADFTFSHEQVREFALSELGQARRRAVHRSIVDLLVESGDPTPAALPLIAQHALAAGDTDRAGRFVLDAARGALQANAAEEALRLIEQGLPVVSTSQDRRELLVTRDDAYQVLRNVTDRLEGLAELGALAEALRDRDLELDVQLRRASTLRMSHDEEAAADIARRVRARAGELGDRPAELRALLELGQALLRTPIGESFGSAAKETDLEGAEEAFRAAAALAEELGDERNLAAALREVAIIRLSHLRLWFGEQVQSGRAVEILARVVSGESVEGVLASTEVAPQVREIRELLERALALFERLQDRTGVMSTVIAMAYVNYAPMIHISSSARHLEEIRRVTNRMASLVTESERARQELQLLYGVHVYARAKVVPDLMINRGIEAHRLAKVQGDRSVEFLAAGGVAMSYLDIGEVETAEQWLDRAATAASASPTPLRARQLETWRGLCHAARGDAKGLREHLERALQMATDSGRPAARCEALANLALAAARLGTELNDQELLTLAESSAQEAVQIATILPGHVPWAAQAQAAQALLALAAGDGAKAAELGAGVIHYLQVSEREDLDLHYLLPAGRAILAGGPPEMQAMGRTYLQLFLSRIVQGTVDDEMRVKWLRGPVGRELTELAGPMDQPMAAMADASTNGDDALAPAPDPMDDVDRQLLHLLTQGSTNREMATELKLEEGAVAQRLARLLARIGASSRAQATSFAFRGVGL
jgi:DNA-binding CsgD family transcriptional regulator/tetratricopeptide (TPR) repeat protein